MIVAKSFPEKLKSTVLENIFSKEQESVGGGFFLCLHFLLNNV